MHHTIFILFPTEFMKDQLILAHTEYEQRKKKWKFICISESITKKHSFFWFNYNKRRRCNCFSIQSVEPTILHNSNYVYVLVVFVLYMKYEVVYFSILFSFGTFSFIQFSNFGIKHRKNYRSFVCQIGIQFRSSH